MLDQPDHSKWDYRPGYLDTCRCIECKSNRPCSKVEKPKKTVDDLYYTTKLGQRLLREGLV